MASMNRKRGGKASTSNMDCHEALSPCHDENFSRLVVATTPHRVMASAGRQIIVIAAIQPRGWPRDLAPRGFARLLRVYPGVTKNVIQKNLLSSH
jgi:hypothetical protein